MPLYQHCTRYSLAIYSTLKYSTCLQYLYGKVSISSVLFEKGYEYRGILGRAGAPPLFTLLKDRLIGLIRICSTGRVSYPLISH